MSRRRVEERIILRALEWSLYRVIRDATALTGPKPLSWSACAALLRGGTPNPREVRRAAMRLQELGLLRIHPVKSRPGEPPHPNRLEAIDYSGRLMRIDELDTDHEQ